MVRASSLLLVLVTAVSLPAQTVASAQPPQLRVCCRPLPKWYSSRNPILFALNRLIVSHLRHCYLDLGDSVTLPGIGNSVQVSGIHPVERKNKNKQPIQDQLTDALIHGGTCNRVEDATPEKILRLQDELTGGLCNSCGSNYHNHPLSFCYNNSNTYVFDLLQGAGMAPPKMRGAPGYRAHHACGGGGKRAASNP